MHRHGISLGRPAEAQNGVPASIRLHHTGILVLPIGLLGSREILTLIWVRFRSPKDNFGPGTSANRHLVIGILWSLQSQRAPWHNRLSQKREIDITLENQGERGQTHRDIDPLGEPRGQHTAHQILSKEADGQPIHASDQNQQDGQHVQLFLHIHRSKVVHFPSIVPLDIKVNITFISNQRIAKYMYFAI